MYPSRPSSRNAGKNRNPPRTCESAASSCITSLDAVLDGASYSRCTYHTKQEKEAMMKERPTALRIAAYTGTLCTKMASRVDGLRT